MKKLGKLGKLGKHGRRKLKSERADECRGCSELSFRKTPHLAFWHAGVQPRHGTLKGAQRHKPRLVIMLCFEIMEFETKLYAST